MIPNREFKLNELSLMASSASEIDISVLKTNSYVTPETFGAVGDGVTDDTYAMNLAISSGNVLCSPSKVYLVGKLNIRSNLTIDLNNSTLRRNIDILPGSDMLWNNYTFMIYINSAITLSNITIKNGIVDDRHTDSTTLIRGFFGVNTGGKVVNLTFDNIEFVNSHSGFISSNLSAVPSISRSKFINCKFTNPTPVQVGTTMSVAGVGKLVPYALVVLNHAEHVLVDNCYMEYSFHGMIADQDDNVLPFRNNNITVSNCRVLESIDTSLYYYASYSTMYNNHVINPGKDGLKINTTLLSLSERNKIIGNTVVGAPAQHQPDGSSLVVMTGGSNICSNNIFNMYGTTQHSVIPSILTIDGENSIVSDNIFTNTITNGFGIKPYAFLYSTTPRKGVSITGNKFDCAGTAIVISEDEHTDLIISNNIIKTYGIGIAFNFTETQVGVRKPINSTISNNRFIAMLPTSRHIYNQYVDRVTFSGNYFSGSGQRDSQPATNIGAWIGYGNQSDGLNDPVYVNYNVNSRGAKYLSAPTVGTFKKGEIVAGDTVGYRCTQSGTLGTLTGVTASTTAGSPNIIVNIDKIIYPGMYITITGESGIFTVKSKSGLNITLTTNVVNTASSVSIQYSPAVFTVGSEYYG